MKSFSSILSFPCLAIMAVLLLTSNLVEATTGQVEYSISFFKTYVDKSPAKGCNVLQGSHITKFTNRTPVQIDLYSSFNCTGPILESVMANARWISGSLVANSYSVPE